MYVDGATKRKVGKEVVVVVAVEECADCKALRTSTLGTAENIIVELLRSLESRAIRLFG